MPHHTGTLHMSICGIPLLLIVCSVSHWRAIIAVGFRPACNRPRDPYMLSCPCSVACVVHVICIYSSSMYCLCCLCHLYRFLIPVSHILYVSYLAELYPCAVTCVVSSRCRCLSCSVFHRRAIIAVGFQPACNHPCDPYMLRSVPVLSPVSFMSFVYTCHPLLPVLSLSSVHREMFHISLSWVPVLLRMSSPPGVAACHVQSFIDGRSLQLVFGLHATALVIHTMRSSVPVLSPVLSLSFVFTSHPVLLMYRMCCLLSFAYYSHNSHPCIAYSTIHLSLAMPVACVVFLTWIYFASLYHCLSCSVLHWRAIIAVGFCPACNRPRDTYTVVSLCCCPCLDNCCRHYSLIIILVS